MSSLTAAGSVNNERTPLLPRRAENDGEDHTSVWVNPSLWFLVTVLTFGASIGGYLLYMQAKGFPVSRPFFLLHRDKWGAHPMRPIGPPYADVDVPLSHVIVVQTGGQSCQDIPSCARRVRDIQKCDRKGDVSFNFLVGADGNTYEGQGWHRKNLLPIVQSSTSLVLAFIGDFTSTVPDVDLLEEAQTFITEAVAARLLKEQYLLVGLRNLSRNAIDGQYLWKAIEKWSNYNATIGAYL